MRLASWVGLALAVASAGCEGSTQEDSGSPTTGAVGASGGTQGSGGRRGSGGSSSSTGGETTSGQRATGGDASTGGAKAPADCPGNACQENLNSGVWAVLSETDVWWDPPPDAFGNRSGVSNPGRGTLSIAGLLTVDDLCSGSMSEFRPCSLELPIVTSNLTCDAYQYEDPVAAWDAATMPSFAATVGLSQWHAGGSLTMDSHPGLIGIALENPETAWPESWKGPDVTCIVNGAPAAGEECFPDHDGDGYPGVTLNLSNTLAPSPAPAECGIFDDEPYTFKAHQLDADIDTLVGGERDDRAKSIHVGMRIHFGGTGVLRETCEDGTGIASEGGQLELRIVGCTRLDGEACSADQTKFLDQHQPQYRSLQAGEVPAWEALPPAFREWPTADKSPSPGPRLRFVRLGDLDGGFTCEDVRSADYPSLPSDAEPKDNDAGM